LVRNRATAHGLPGGTLEQGIRGLPHRRSGAGEVGAAGRPVTNGRTSRGSRNRCGRRIVRRQFLREQEQSRLRRCTSLRQNTVEQVAIAPKLTWNRNGPPWPSRIELPGARKANGGRLNDDAAQLPEDRAVYGLGQAGHQPHFAASKPVDHCQDVSKSGWSEGWWGKSKGSWCACASGAARRSDRLAVVLLVGLANSRPPSKVIPLLESWSKGPLTIGSVVSQTNGIDVIA